MAYVRSKELQEKFDLYEKKHTCSEALLTKDFLDSVDNETEVAVEADPTPAQGPELGISDLLISAINDEWNTISMYNNMIAQIDAEKYLDMIPVIQDIVAEENVHVGQLQKLLETISSNTQEIEKGELEADEQLSNPLEVE